MISAGLFSFIVWVFGPGLALVGAVVLVVWLLAEMKAGYYQSK